MKYSKQLVCLLTLCLILTPLGCSDKSSTNPVPPEFVGTWWYLTASLDGVPYASYSEVANVEGGVAASVIFASNGTWNSEEYDADQNVIFTQSGTFSATADSLTLIKTMSGGNPLDNPVTVLGSYVIVSDVLTITHVVGPPGETHTLIEYWEKE